VHRLAEGFLLRPEIVSVDRSVSEPKRAMMSMIVILPRGVFHGPIARHRGVARADEGITVWARHIPKEILREKHAVDVDAQPVLTIAKQADPAPAARSRACPLPETHQGAQEG